MSYFATPYTIHFDDTMAYGSHHFLTAFKFQCAGREALLYGDLIFDRPGVKEALEKIHLFTADAYSRNLSPVFLGDRVAILISLEEWGRVSARFCYRMLGQQGQAICAGFQTMICADAKTGMPIPLPVPLREAFDDIREITEIETDELFRDRVLAGADATERLFTDEIRSAALNYLSDRYPHPRIISAGDEPVAVSNGAVLNDAAAAVVRPLGITDVDHQSGPSPTSAGDEAWVFPGQGAFDAVLLCERIQACTQLDASLRSTLDQCADVVQQELGVSGTEIVSGSIEDCLKATRDTAGLAQVGIHLQGVLGALLREQLGEPAVLLGHSFGELAALNVAGCFDVVAGVRIVCQRVRIVEEFGPQDGGLLVAATSRRAVAEEISVAQLTGIAIAGRNHEKQTVLSGQKSQLERLQSHLRQIGVESVSIPSPTSFHHPSLREAADAWFRELRSTVDFRPPCRTVYSPIGRRELTGDDDLAAILSSHLLRPFDLQGALGDLVAAGTTQFVDCGSAGSLRRLLLAAEPDAIEVVGVEDGLPASMATTSRQQSVSAKRPLPPASPAIEPQQQSAALPAAVAAAEQRYEESSASKVARPAIAIVGQGCLLPGRATSPSELYAAIQEGRLGIVDQRQLDPDWERDFYSASLVPDRSTSALAGRIDNRDLVKPPQVDEATFAAFSRPQQVLCIALAQCADPLQKAERVLCLVGSTADGFKDQDNFAALRYAGVDVFDAEVAQRVGTARAASQDPHSAIQEVFDCVVRPGLEITLIDAACASSLYSIALGMQALEDFDADVVLAGGVFCPGPGNNCLFSQFGGLTSTGCRPFDAGADGVVFSEGAAMVVLQRLQDAEREQASICGVVRGAGLSSDGRSPSANVPQTAGQLLALQRCYANYEVDPESIVAIEAHGTSTPVGDATELKTLATFFEPFAKEPLQVHSLKGLLGHTGWAAGTASVIAASEALQAGLFPGQAFFREPSNQLNESSALAVAAAPLTFSDSQGGIAIDGFGFGGSNAHVVVEPYHPSHAETAEPECGPPVDDDEWVLVGWHRLAPTEQETVAGGKSYLRFDRDAVAPEGMLILPDLADDMDVTQSLALSIIGETLAQIEGFDDALKSRTGIVLAQQGKTERAVEATTRVLEPRLVRDLEGLPAAAQVQAAAKRARPSGAYTLQCMMPNVSAGRAALQFNLNGPNFVVDAGHQSFVRALEAAKLLLRSGPEGGSQVVVVAAISANRWSVMEDASANPEDEYAVAFALTTRRNAQACGLTEVGELPDVARIIKPGQGVGEQLEKFVANISHPAASPEVDQLVDDEFPLHYPTWVAAAATPQATAGNSGEERWLVIAAADRYSSPDVAGCLQHVSRDHLVVLVGESAAEVAGQLALPTVQAVDLHDEATASEVLDRIAEFAPDVVLALDQPSGWQLEEALGQVVQNELCELLFLAMKRLAPRLREGLTEVWGLFPGGWNGSIHPVSGGVTGLIKAAKRELPSATMGVLSLDNRSLQAAVTALQQERSSGQNTEQEIVYEEDRRLVRRLRAVTDECLTSSTAMPQLPLDQHSVVIASGGARGVTAVAVEALLQDHQCTVIALGRSPLERGPANINSPEVESEYYARYVEQNPGASPVQMRQSFAAAQARWEAQETIDNLAACGGKVRYLAVDVTDRAAVDDAVEQVVAEFGRVDLLIHGAGVQWSKRIEDRSLAEFRKTFDVKVTGLNHLMESCRARLGRTVAAHIFTSAYSIFGNDGQHDYGAANETMDRLCGLTGRLADHRWASIAWSAWDGIGMTRGSEYRALAERRNLRLLGAEGGQRIFRAVLSGRTAAEINVPLSQAEQARYLMRTVPTAQGEVLKTSETRIELTDIDCLSFHHARGVPTLPGAWIFNYMAKAALDLYGKPANFVTIQDIGFHRFVRLANEVDPNVRIVVDQMRDRFAAWMIGDIVNPEGIALRTDVVFAKAMISIGEERTLGAPSLNGISHNGNGATRTVSDPYCGPDQSVQLSGPFDCLRNITIGELGRRAIFMPDLSTCWDGVVPSLLLDASLRVAGMHVAPGLHVPTKIDRAVIPVGLAADSSEAAGWKIRTTSPVVDGDNIRCETVEVTDESGELRLRVEGAMVTRIR